MPSEILKGFKGYLQTDGYAGYNAVCASDDVIRLGCMAHLRRKFRDVQKASQTKNKAANKIIKLIADLYKIESFIKDKNTDERKQIRLAKAKPILDNIKTWLDSHQTSYNPKGLMGKAIIYATNQWPYIINYLLDGRLSLDNNFTENRIRPFAIGRKNWLFSDSVKGAKASARLYSLLQTARANGHEPYAYMRYLLTNLPSCKTSKDLEKLAPHKIEPTLLY